MRDSFMLGIVIYILSFFLVSALLPTYLFTGTTLDTDVSKNALLNGQSTATDDNLSLTKIRVIFSLFFAPPVLSGIPSIIAWILLLFNYVILFSSIVWGYNKVRGIQGN